MADLAAFRAWRYALERVGGSQSVLAPPYDVISHDEAHVMAASSPYHVIHLILGKPAPGARFSDDDYAHAARRWCEWREEGILVHDGEPALYLYDCEFDDLLTGERVERKGVLGALRLTPFEEGSVLPHEEVFSAPLADRARLIRAADAGFSAILGLYDDPADEARRVLEAADPAPILEYLDPQGALHRLARVALPEALRGARDLLLRSPLIIADGHHRYTAQLDYARERERLGTDLPGGRCLACVINASDPGVRAYGTHRLFQCGGTPPDLAPLTRIASVTGLEGWDPRVALQALRAMGETACGYVFVTRAGMFRVLVEDPATLASLHPDTHPALRALPLTVLHRAVLTHGLGLSTDDLDADGGVSHTRDAADAIRWVRGARYDLAVLVNAPAMSDVFDICTAGQRMPHKSTFFYPKLMSGTAFYDLAQP